MDDRWFIPRTWAVPLLFGVFVFLAIDSYALRAFGNYNRQVAGYALTAAATLLLIASFGGRRFRSVGPVLPLGMAFALSVAVSTWRAPHLYWALDQLHLYYARAPPRRRSVSDASRGRHANRLELPCRGADGSHDLSGPCDLLVDLDPE